MAIIAHWVGAEQRKIRVVVGTDVLQNIKVRYSTDEAFASYQETSVQQTQNPHFVVKFEIGGLDPHTTYHYQIFAGGEDSGKGGSVRTFPEGPANLKIAHGGDESNEAGHAFSRILDKDCDLLIHLGDMWHNDATSSDESQWTSRFRSYLGHTPRKATISSVPTLYMPDDHDGAGNDYGAGHPYIPSVVASYQRWVPHTDLPLVSEPSLYQKVSIGRVDVFLLDARNQRTSSTQLGAAQLQRLKDDLSASTAAIKLIAHGGVWIGNSSDEWGGGDRNLERKEICDHIADNAIGGVVMIEGGAHATVWDDGTNADYSTAGTPDPLRSFRAGPLNSTGGSGKGGPYSAGDQIVANAQNYGLFEITDDGGDEVQVTWTGFDATDDSVIYTTSFSFDVEPWAEPSPSDPNLVFAPAPSEPLTFAPAGALDEPEAPNAAPTVTLTPASQTALNLSLSEVDGATGYRYRVGTSGSWTDLGSGRTAQITGLSPGTSYTVQARAYNAAGDGPIGTATASTLEPEVNAPPVFQTSPPTSVRAGQVYVYNGVVTDADGDPITITLEEGPDWLELTDHGDGTFTLEGTAPNE